MKVPLVLVIAIIVVLGAIASVAAVRPPAGPVMALHFRTRFLVVRVLPKPCVNEMLEKCDQPTLDCAVRREEDLMSVDRDSKIVVACTCTEHVR